MRVSVVSTLAALAALAMSPLLTVAGPAAAQSALPAKPGQAAPADPRDLDRRKAEADARRAAEERARRAAAEAAYRAGTATIDVQCRVSQVRLDQGILMIGCMDRPQVLNATDPPVGLDGPNFYLPIAEDPVLAQLAVDLASDAYHADAAIRFKGSRRRDADPVLGYGGMYRLSFAQVFRPAR
jgi:hypothetical protein